MSENSIISILGDTIRNKDLAKCLGKIIKNEKSTEEIDLERNFLAERFIRGERLTDTERRKLGLSVKELDRHLITNESIADLFNIFKARGYKIIFILLP